MYNIKTTIGQRINNILAEKNIKQKELATALNVTDNTISYFCKGTRTPNTEQIIKIADFFEVTTDYLLGRSNVKTLDTDIQSICKYTGLSDEAVTELNLMTYSSIEELQKINLIKRYSSKPNVDLLQQALSSDWDDTGISIDKPNIKAYTSIDLINLILEYDTSVSSFLSINPKKNFDEVSNLSILSTLCDIVNLKFLDDSKISIGYHGDVMTTSQAKLEGHDGYIVSTKETIENILFDKLKNQLKNLRNI